MKLRFILFSLLVVFLAIFTFLHWPASDAGRLPIITDAARLRQDCVELCQQYPIKEINTNLLINRPKFLEGVRRQQGLKIPSEKWPSSIQALKPFQVTRDEYAVGIWIAKNPRPTGPSGDPQVVARNWLAKGYYVHTNPKLSPPRSADHGFAYYFLYATEFEGIDEFVVPAGVL